MKLKSITWKQNAAILLIPLAVSLWVKYGVEKTLNPLYIGHMDVSTIMLSTAADTFIRVEDPKTVSELTEQLEGTYLIPDSIGWKEPSGESVDLTFYEKGGTPLILIYDPDTHRFVNAGKPTKPGVYEAVDAFVKTQMKKAAQ